MLLFVEIILLLCSQIYIFKYNNKISYNFQNSNNWIQQQMIIIDSLTFKCTNLRKSTEVLLGCATK